MLLKAETRQIQEDLARYCRDGILPELPGALKDRLPHYRRLVYNVIYGLMEKAFPITYSRLSVPEFKEMISAFMLDYNAQSSQVWKLPGEFAGHISSEDLKIKVDHPYLNDLLAMEWTEILVYNRENNAIEAHQAIAPSESRVPVLNPDAEILSLDFPVFKGNWEKIDGLKGRYYLLLFRNLETFKVHFMELSALHLRLLECWNEGMNLEEAMKVSLMAFDLDADEKNLKSLLNFTQKLYSDGFILGVKG